MKQSINFLKVLPESKIRIQMIHMLWIVLAAMGLLILIWLVMLMSLHGSRKTLQATQLALGKEEIGDDPSRQD